MIARRFIPGRTWSGAGRAAPFATRNEGFQRSHRVWICRACRAWNEAVGREVDGVVKERKPAACIHCQGPTSGFLAFDSALEAQRFARLWMLHDEGEISALRHHPRFDLHVPAPGGGRVKVAVYEADSEYRRDGEWIVEDVKPPDPRAQDPVFRLKRKMFEAEHGRRLRIVSKV